MDEDLNSFLAGYEPPVRQIVIELRKLILAVMPGAIEQVDPPSKIIAYGYGRKYADLVCAIAPFTSYVNLMFSRGVELDDPQHVLTGTGKRARHIKIARVEEVRQPVVMQMLHKAIGLTKT